MSGRAPSYPGAPPRNPACGLPAPGSSNQLTRAGSSRQEPQGHGNGPLRARHARPDDTLVVGPFPPRALPRFPGTMGRSDTRHPHVWLGITLPATPPAKVTGPMAGSPGFRALPVPACRRLRPRWTRVCSRPGERPLLPSPPLHTGRRPRCWGFRGWSRSLPQLADFGPQGSCLRFVRDGHPPRRKTRSQRRGGSLRRRWDSPRTEPMRRSPTGKRRLTPAHATSPKAKTQSVDGAEIPKSALSGNG